MGNSPPGQRTFKRLLDSYLERQRVYSKPASVRQAGYCGQRLIAHFGSRSIYELNSGDVDSYIVKRREQGVSDTTVNGDLMILRAILNHGVNVGLIKSAPFKVKLLKVRRKRAAKVLTPGDVKKLLDHAKGRIYGILLVALHTGFRTNEILHLRWSDVVWDRCMLTVTGKPGVWTSKSYQDREVFVSPRLLEWLKKYREKTPHRGEDDWVYATRSGRPLDIHNVCRDVQKVFQKAGIYQKGASTIHLIRHSVASSLLSNGVDLECVREILGHADLKTTALYLHTTEERKRAASQKLDLAG